MKIALGQINPTVGDFAGNAAKIIEFSRRAQASGAGLVLFPELSVCGYPPRDLVERASFVQHNRETVDRIAAETRGIAVICGLVTPAQAESGKSVMNSAALLKDGKTAFLQSKMLLPTYDVFDEMRNFAPGKSQVLFPFCGKQMALTICEDAWNDKHFWNKRLYTFDPVEALVHAGGNFLLNVSASPFWLGKRELRRDMLATIARSYKVPVAMVNQVGGNDSLVFDGSSLVFNPAGEVIAQGKSFEEDIVYFDSDQLTGEVHDQIEGEEASAYSALVLGTRDYVRKCGFRQVIVALSGGIDSALTAAIAYQLADVHFERGGKPFERPQRRDRLAVFNLGNVGAGNLHAAGQLTLAQVAGLANLLHLRRHAKTGVGIADGSLADRNHFDVDRGIFHIERPVAPPAHGVAGPELHQKAVFAAQYLALFRCDETQSGFRHGHLYQCRCHNLSAESQSWAFSGDQCTRSRVTFSEGTIIVK